MQRPSMDGWMDQKVHKWHPIDLSMGWMRGPKGPQAAELWFDEPLVHHDATKLHQAHVNHAMLVVRPAIFQQAMVVAMQRPLFDGWGSPLIMRSQLL